MNNDSKLALCEKIRLIRSAKQLSIDNMARATNNSKSTISRIETGKIGCSPENLRKIREFLKIKNAPLLELELKVYRNRLWMWYDIVSVVIDRFDEARLMQDELAAILDLPYEHDLIGLYLMTEAMLLAKEGNIDAVIERLNHVAKYLDNASEEVLHMYHCNMGFAHSWKNEPRQALAHYKMALNYLSYNLHPGLTVYHTIGTLYAKIGKPAKSILYLERVRNELSADRTSIWKRTVWRCAVDCELALLYTYLDELTKARQLLDPCLVNVGSTRDGVLLTRAHKNMARVSIKEDKYDEALSHIEQAIEYVGDDKQMYFSLLIDKAGILQKLKRVEEYQDLLMHIREGVRGDSVLSFMVDTIEHLGNIYDPGSIKYLETVSIPKLKAGDGHDKFVALDICNELEAVFKKKNSKTKAMAIGVVARDIYMDLFIGDVINEVP